MALPNLISLSLPLTHALVCLLTISLSTLSQALVEDWDRSLCLSVDPNPISVLQQDFSLTAPPLPSGKLLVPPSVCPLCLLSALFLNVSHLCSGCFYFLSHICKFLEDKSP